MAGRRFVGVVILAAGLHAVGIARSSLPAQDGLKLLAVARGFQTSPWIDVIRGSDRHPLYPLLVAAIEPVVALATGHGPDSFRLAAQGVSAVASILLLFPLFALARGLFDERTAVVAVFLFVLLPVVSSVGHDTLSDATALTLFAAALMLAERAWRSGRWAQAFGSGGVAGLGYWARPELAVVAGVSCAMLVLRAAQRAVRGGRWDGAAPALLGGAFLATVGLYAVTKGEVSEKLALRRSAAIASDHDRAQKPAHPLPPGLDDPRWDFAPKEESGAPATSGVASAAGVAVASWAEALGWILAPLAIWGALRVRSGPGRWIVGAYVLAFGAVVTRHAAIFGYLSPRHLLTLGLATIPWAAAGLIDVFDRLASRRGWTEPVRRRRAWIGVAVVLVVGVAAQAKPAHASRWGHLQAGRWLAKHAAGDGDVDDVGDVAVLDTRGWASFVSGCRSYDPWHVRQALGDARLGYVVIGADELAAPSRRAATWRAVLDFAGERVAAFPAFEGGRGADVLVYRFRRPGSWEGLAP